MPDMPIIVAAATFLLGGCFQSPPPETSKVSASAIPGEGATELWIRGEGMTPSAEVAIKIQHFPGRVGDITRGTTAAADGSFVFRESFPRVSVEEREPKGYFIISAWDTTGASVAVISKPIDAFIEADAAP
jgi:hypothetical protein